MGQSERQETLDHDRNVCPGPDCLMCNGEACALCGAGCSNTDPARPVCEHDVIERHTEQSVGVDRFDSL
jgi:hypothetical protein